MKTWKLFSLVTATLVGFGFFASSPATALEIQLNDQLEIDTDEDDTELRPRFSTDGERVNFELYEQPEPETKIRIDDGEFQLRQEREPAEERLEFSVPVDED